MPKQEELRQLEVRPIEPNESEKWDALMDEQHYLGFRRLVGETVKYSRGHRSPP